MNERFADTFYFLALFSADDEAHERAFQLNRERKGVVVTTEWVLTEVADALAAPETRATFTLLLAALRGDLRAIVVPADTKLFDRGVVAVCQTTGQILDAHGLHFVRCHGRSRNPRGADWRPSF